MSKLSNGSKMRGSKLPFFLALTTAGLLLAALPVAAKPKPAAVPVAVIENSGSTNTTGYRVTVSPDGHCQSEVTGLITTGPAAKAKLSVLPSVQAKKLFQDLAAAMPLTSLPAGHGMRSASFGTRTTITYKAQRSPDLTFAFEPRTAALKADIDAITKTLHVGNAPKRPIVIHADR